MCVCVCVEDSELVGGVDEEEQSFDMALVLVIVSEGENRERK